MHKKQSFFLGSVDGSANEYRFFLKSLLICMIENYGRVIPSERSSYRKFSVDLFMATYETWRTGMIIYYGPYYWARDRYIGRRIEMKLKGRTWSIECGNEGIARYEIEER